MSWQPPPAGAATWPLYAPRILVRHNDGTSTTYSGSGPLTFRANPDAGVCFVVGSVNTTPLPIANGYAFTYNVGDPLPAAFRPLSPVTLQSSNTANSLTVGTDGFLTGMGDTFTFRTFYFTTVTPG